ncbi:Uncharacterised protein [Mycobacterium tuberculosis]|uniref:Uncharacterized protein n=2 Tax=Mycobacterium tuberculosis TaxID=1773 RepID=A0A655ABL4_MYCTX|nr:Uncharacterised protein [Mycobacterium tuberculosis]
MIGLTRDQPALAGFVGAPSRALNRALSCQFNSADADDTSWLLVSSMIRPSPRRSTASAGMSGSAIGCSAARTAQTWRPPSTRPRNTASGGGLSASSMAAPSNTRPLATSTRLRESTRSNAAPGHPAAAASMSVLSRSARSAPTRESNGTLLS